MTKMIDMTGMRFGHLTVIERAPSLHGHIRWRCLCDCGKETVTHTTSLRSGNAQSCGCQGRKKAKESITKHGENKTPLHNKWTQMRSRCRESDKSHKAHYFDRGITVCPEWDDYVVFAKWARANGYMEGLELDRIDNDKGYSPDNCRWVTHSINMRNRSNAVFVVLGGKQVNLAEACEKHGANYKHVHGKIRKGVPAELALGITHAGR